MDFCFVRRIEIAAKMKYTTMKIRENAQWILIPIDMDKAIVTARPTKIFIRLMRSSLVTAPL